MENRGMTQEDAAARIDVQNSRRGIGNVEEELENGSISCIIENNGDIDELTSKLNVAWNDPESWGAVNVPKRGGLDAKFAFGSCQQKVQQKCLMKMIDSHTFTVRT